MTSTTATTTAPHGRRRRAAAARRRAQQGLAEPERLRHAARGRLRAAHRLQAARARRPRQRRRVLLPAPPRHRGVRGGGHPRPRHHRPRPAARLRGQGRGVGPQLGFGRSTFRFAAPPGRARHAWTTWPASASPRRTTVWSQRYLQERGIDATVIRLDGAVETSVQLGVADVIADVVETGSTLRQAGLEIVGDVIMESEAVLDQPRRRGGAPRPRGLPAPAAGRPGGPLLRDDGLRHPLGRGRGGGRADPRHREPHGLAAAPRGLGRGALDGAARRRPSGSWTSCTRSAPAASSPPTSMPAGSDPAPGRPGDLPVTLPPAGCGSPRSSSAVCCWSTVVVVCGCPSPTTSGSPSRTFQRLTVLVLGLMVLGIGHGALALPRRRRRDGLRVVNGYRTHDYAWPEVVAVTLRPGNPWAVLDLSDGTVAGGHGHPGLRRGARPAQVRRLRALVEAHAADEPPRPSTA